MLIDKLLDHFDDYEEIPVDVNDVRERLIAMGVQDEITFHFVKMDKDKIRGILYRYTRHASPYGEPILCSDICIADDQGDETEAWHRLVAVKEMLHISDCTNLTAASEEAIDNLFTALSLPPDLRAPEVTDKRSVLNDRMRTYIALAILIPRAAREALRKVYLTQLTDDEIALMAGVPIRYVDVVMGTAFERSIKIFVEWEGDAEKE